MIFESINLEEELRKERNSTGEASKQLLDSANQILKESVIRHKEDFAYKSLDPGRIFNINEIKSICINYRLRFLDLEKFKGEIPEEGNIKLEELKQSLGSKAGKLKIVAPSSLFKLEEKDSDPLLLMSLGNNNYYLIHQWGSDLKWYRKWLALGFRSLQHFMVFLILAAFTFAQLAPIGSFPGVAGHDGVFSVFRLYLFAFTLISFCSLSVFALFTFRKNFSDQEWKSKFLS